MTVVVTKMVNHCLRPVSSLPPSYLLTQCEVGLLHPPAALWTRQVVEDEWVGGLQGRVRETEDPNESGTSVITHWEFSFLPVIINLAAGGRPPQKNVTTGHKIQLVVMTGNESLIVLVLLEHTLLFTQLNFFFCYLVAGLLNERQNLGSHLWRFAWDTTWNWRLWGMKGCDVITPVLTVGRGAREV